MKVIHEKNNARIKEIVSEYGWPGFSMVGKEGSKAAWLIVQHAVLDTEFMDKCLPLLKETIIQGEAEGWCLAYLQDRGLTMQVNHKFTAHSMILTKTALHILCQ